MNEDAATAQALGPVRHAVTVPLSPQQAFTLFTSGYNTWWPAHHHIGQAELAQAVLEPRTGGRYYERGADGSECEWGKVLVCDPPRRLVLAWQITERDGDWVYNPDISRASEVEVTFQPEPGGQTKVELEHRHIGRHGAGAASIHRGVCGTGGWSAVLESYTMAATAA